ncbi:MAG: PEP-CTERM sorting domain-containing protein [Gemmataceae bacterium]
MSWSASSRTWCVCQLTLAAIAILCNGATAQPTFTDNFNTGTDTGWTRYQPLLPFGAPGNWSFPNGNQYRIQAATSPDAALGPARAASVRADLTYTNFVMTADLINFDGGLAQSFGLGNRLSSIGLGTTNGYLFLYDPTGVPTATIYRVNGENVTDIGNADITLIQGVNYRFRFDGTGTNFVGQIFTVANPTVPLITINATDAQFASGNPGLVVAANGNGPTGGPADATFDNFFVSPVPEPSSFMLAGAGLLGWAVRRRRK